MTRTFWYHPESDSYWATDGEPDIGDGMSMEVTREDYLAGIRDAFLASVADRTGGARVVVFGGRDFTDEASLFYALDDFHHDIGISCLIEGGARGADHLAMTWATRNLVPRERYDADWNRLHDDAGPERNQRMIDEGKPDCGIAFRGGNGTADMKSRMELAGLPVFEIL